MKSDNETEFFLRKLEFDYGDKKAEQKLRKLSREIGWLKGWPKDKKAFWNGEAFMWRNKISKEKRELIKKELAFLEGKNGKNLDLGCGSYSYVKSIGFDVSEKMLLLNDNLSEKVAGDLEEKLPFEDGEFDSVTMVFVLDYIKNYLGMLKEIGRVLKKKGRLVIVQGETNEWWGKKRKNKLGMKELREILKGEGFKVKGGKKQGLLFLKAFKSK